MRGNYIIIYKIYFKKIKFSSLEYCIIFNTDNVPCSILRADLQNLKNWQLMERSNATLVMPDKFESY